MPQENIMRQLIEPSFGGDRTYTIGFVYLDLMVGPIRTAHQFHIIDAQTSYHLLLGQPWMHWYKAILSMSPMFESIIEEKRVYINAT